MKTIYIMLTNTGTVFTRMIGFYTKAPYNHVSIALDCHFKYLYSFGRKHPRNPLFGGFVKEDLEGGVYKIFDKTRCRIYSMDVEDDKYLKLENILKGFIARSNFYSYNLAGLIGVMVNRPIERKRAFFCSEFVATVLKESGIDIFNKCPSLVTPEDFLNCRELCQIHEGYLYEFSNRIKSSYV